MSRLQQTFRALRESRRTALIPYITAGDPHPEVTVEMMHAMVKAGANIVEVGVPFSDPMADGPVIQAACERALKHKVSLSQVLEMVRNFRKQDRDTPVVLMGYANPVEVMGYEKFAQSAAEAGVDGVITVDLPPEESAGVLPHLRQAGIDPVFLLAPTSTDERIRKICAAASGFVYYVSLKGVTGASTLDLDSVAARLADIRKHTVLPIGVGFGIKNAATARQVGAIADAVVVGSALVQRIADLADNPAAAIQAVSGVLAEMRKGLDEGSRAAGEITGIKRKTTDRGVV
ncbi:MAG TPA: tryptophan synthase subunit alpha [Gammaproteobacteria bacterium]|nr:tryptophan synthase subunit alpha [Gammaproteobacteria bacterium]